MESNNKEKVKTPLIRSTKIPYKVFIFPKKIQASLKFFLSKGFLPLVFHSTLLNFDTPPLKAPRSGIRPCVHRADCIRLYIVPGINKSCTANYIKNPAAE